MRLLLVEDDEKLAEYLIKGFHQAGFKVDHAHNGPDGLALAKLSFYDAGIVDVMLPGLDGFSLIEHLRREKFTTPLLILSARQSVDDRVTGLHAGGDDYLVKPFSFTELLARIHALIRRAQGHGESTWLKAGDLSLDFTTREVWRNGQRIELQNREFELLAYLMRNRGRVVSKTMIIENVWNFNFDPHTNIVEARISKLREKVDKPFKVKLIHTLRGAGYVLRGETLPSPMGLD